MSTTATFATVPFSRGKWHWLCLVLAGLATLALVAGPLESIAHLIFPDTVQSFFHYEIVIRNTIHVTGAIPLAYRLGLLLCDSVPTGLAMWCAWSMRQLFLGFARGEVFTASALRYLNHTALALLLSEITDILMQAPETALATWTLGHGKRAISLGLGDGDIATIFIAGAAFIIARVMAEARRIADENAGIV